MPPSSFPVRFAGKLRPTQRDAIKIAVDQLSAGQRRIHLVAPPGSGKTVLGLYLWAEHIQTPAVVLSPNSAIQSQWAARLDLFDTNASAANVVSTDPRRPGLLTSLTYQSVTLPCSGDEDLDTQAIELWQEQLVEKGQAEDLVEAEVWIDDLKDRNPDYHDRRLATYRKAVRDRMASSGNALHTLHDSALDTLHRLRDANVGLVILDECHHLMGHWGRVLADARELLKQPVVIGLTATPPDRSGKSTEDIERYDEFFGPVDFETPVPAVVKDGFLAPFQDLAYLTRPTAAELNYLATIDREFVEVLEELCQTSERPPETHVCDESLPDWLTRVLGSRELPTGAVKDWATFERRDPELARAGRTFLASLGCPMPRGVPPADVDDVRKLVVTESGVPAVEVVMPAIDRYVRHRLRRSDDPADHALAERAIARLRMLGVQITETGARACASPAGRVMAYSRSKSQALLPILKAEQAVLGERIRAVVVADYEKTSAVAAEVDHLLDEEAGGAIAAFRMLLTDQETDRLDPVLVTGSTVLVDDDLAERFLEEAWQWLADQGLQIELTYTEAAGFFVLSGKGSDWCPRVYVRMITELFQRGVTRCLVGTRGLLGEGWDAHTVNVLVNLAVTTTSTSVNQLCGRSIRLDPDDPEKLADNWDVVCIAPEFAKGLADYHRFIARHRTIYGLTDDGAIEKGVGHVHAAFTELKPEGIEGTVGLLNAEMLGRAARRDEFRKLWRIGQPFCPDPIHALEVQATAGGGGFPPFGKMAPAWSDSSLALAVGQAVLESLVEARLLAKRYTIHAGDRAGGYVRLFVENATEEDGRLFCKSIRESLGPLDRPRYVIPRYVDDVSDTWLSGVLPEILARYLRRRTRRMAVLHAVPTALSKHKNLASIYTAAWNRHVSPGDALYAHRGEGEQLLRDARRDGQVPTGTVRDKEVFL